MFPKMSVPKTPTLEQAESLTVIDGGKLVAVQRGEHVREIPARWLRLLVSIQRDSGQRDFDSPDLPSEIRVRNASFDEEQGVWQIRFEGETSTIAVEIDQLLACNDSDEINGPDRTPFSSADQPVRAVDYSNLEAPAALRSFLGTLFRRGYARVRDVPVNDRSLAKFAGMLGCGRDRPLWMFEETVTSGDTGRTNSSQGSAPHTDLSYRDPVPAFQAQLCLDDSVSGGELFLVDGMTATETLAAESPIAAAELARWPMLFKCRDGSSDYQRAAPLFETTPEGQLRRFTFDDRAAVDFLCPDDRLAICSDAYDQLARIVNREGLRNRFRVQQGDLVVFDNARLLHGRMPVSGAGSRRFQCCYLDRGDLLSTWRRARAGDLD